MAATTAPATDADFAGLDLAADHAHDWVPVFLLELLGETFADGARHRAVLAIAPGPIAADASVCTCGAVESA